MSKFGSEPVMKRIIMLLALIAIAALVAGGIGYVLREVDERAL